MATIQLKHGERVLKLRPQSMNIANLAMIFKLEATEGIYLTSEEGEIILPGEDSFFQMEDLSIFYTVNGEPAIPRPYPNAALGKNGGNDLNSRRPLGLPLSYQPLQTTPASRTTLNPPPARSTPTPLARPSFRTRQEKGWKKSFTVIDITSSGAINEKYQLHITLHEQNATVESIKELLKGQLGYEVSLLDSKQLPVLPGANTMGSQFWRSSRKIFVANVSEARYLKKGSKSVNKRKRTDILDRLKRLVAGSDDESNDDFQPNTFGRQYEQPTRNPNNQREPTVITAAEDGKQVLRNIFKCTICMNTAKLPAAACSSCFRVIGCVHCFEQWYETSNTGVKWPLCRGTTKYDIIPILREVAEILEQPLQIPPPPIQVSDSESIDTIPYGEQEDPESFPVESDEELPPMLE